MNQLKITIRKERPEDYQKILQLTYKAFLTLQYPGRQRVDEHFLYALLQNSESLIPELCFVAEYEGQIVGHIVYTKSKLKRSDGSVLDTITFGPLSVLPQYHHQGIGKALIQHSIKEAKQADFKAILIFGVPDYYPRFGFKRAREYQLTFTDGSAPDAFMVYELVTGCLLGGGVYHWAPEYDVAENDYIGYEAFHKQFIKNSQQK